MKQPYLKPITYKLKASAGFTLIELLIIAGITVMLTSVVTVSFRGLRSSQEINAARTDFLSKMREVQGNVLGGKIVPGTSQAADAYVITMNTGSQTYQIDYEVNCEVACIRTFLETVRYSQFGRGVTLGTITKSGNRVFDNITVVVRISAPYGVLLIDGLSNEVIVTRLRHTSGQTKDVVIDGISGRVAPQ